MLIGLLASLIFYSSAFQTFVVRTYANSLAKKLNNQITIKSVKVNLFKQVVLGGVYIEDQKGDTLLYAKDLRVDVEEFSLNDKVVKLDDVKLTDVFFNLKKYKTDTVVNLKFLLDYFASNDTTKSNWEFALNEVELENTRFNFNDEHAAPIDKGIDFKHLSLNGIDLLVSDIKLIDKGVDCKIERLNLKEQSGFTVNEFYTEANVTPSGIITQNLKIKTNHSDIDGNVTFLTKNYASLANFIEDVKIKSHFSTTKFSGKDLFYFAPTMEGFNKSIDFEGEIKGEINNLKARKFSFVSDDGTRFRGKIDLSGLPDPDDMFWHVDVKELITTKEKIETFPLFPLEEGNYVSLPDNFRHLGALRFNGNFTGFHHDFVAYGKLNTAIGKVSTDVSVKIKEGMPYYKGKVISNHFHVGRLAGIPKEMGEVTMNIDVDGKGFNKDQLDADFKGKMQQIVVKGYEYNNVDVNGHFKDSEFNGYLAVEDENIGFDFNGSVNLRGKQPEFHFISNIKDAKLAKLNLIDSKQKLKTRFSTQVEVNLIGNHVDNLVGDIKIMNSEYEDLIDTIIVDSALIESKIKNNIRNINITSGLLDAEVNGEFYFEELGKFISNFFVRYVPSQIDETHTIINLSHDLEFMVHLHNSDLIEKIYVPHVDFSDHTIFEGNYNSKSHILSINANSPFINAYGLKVTNIKLQSRTNEKGFDFEVMANKIAQNDSVYMDNFKVDSYLEKDSALTTVSWDNTRDSVKNKGQINFSTIFNGFDSYRGAFNNSYAYIGDSLWTIKDRNSILKDTAQLLISSLSISSGNQQILIDGRLSDDPFDQIDVLLKRFNLKSIEKLIPSNIIQLEGVINGVASITKQNKELIYTSDLKFDKLRVNHSLLGKGELQAGWNSTNQSLSVDGEFYRDHVPTILFSGNYYPNKLEEKFDILFQLHQTELSMFEEYIKDNITDLNGVANAKIKLTGQPKKPKLNGNITLQNIAFTVNYLNTTYFSKYCKVNILPDMISFDNVEISDTRTNKAYANGTIFHQWFKDVSIDIGLDAHNFLVLNTTEYDNNLYNGRAFVSGFVSVGSYNKHMLIDAEIKTEKNTVINIPLDDNQDVVENNFIEFVSKDSSDIELKVEEEIDLTNIEMNFDMEITPDAQVRLVFDDKIGDVMRSTGTGNITLNVSNDGDLNMFGNYTVKDGDYLFTLQNVINKRFDLEEGGTIKWSGSPYEAEINLTAVYRLRARLYDLLVNIDTSDIYKKRIPVDLKLKMQNQMMNPDIGFDIDLPTADEDTKNKMNSVLYVSDKEENIQELNKQVFSLLVLNSFVSPPGSEAAYGHANVGSTTSSELLSNQLSNWLSKISNDFDIGVNYRPGDELSGDELELALSTQLFNDRVVVDGNFGVGGNQNVSSTSETTNNLIGDISVEYKISKDGKLRAKAFNNSNQFSFQNNNSAYTQGLGLSYKEEYDTGKEFWQKFLGRFRKKKNKEE